MKPPAEKRDSRLMRQMFGAIAPRYDFVTRLFSFGMDMRWKRLAVEKATLSRDPLMLDLACGTGDFARLMTVRFPRTRALAIDLTEGMLHRARERGVTELACADAGVLPFADESFDCVFIGYGLRNFTNLKEAVREIGRVTRPGGQIVSLDFFLPPNPIFRRMFIGYLYAQGAMWGLLLHGRARTYTYIPDSLRNFVSMAEYSALLQREGFTITDSRAFILGGIGLHWAAKRSSV
jgi:demethylmenaquinone methyltransferase / 2-methoxy-6-polyprenyl-1,4-benzoquinol methylase